MRLTIDLEDLSWDLAWGLKHAQWRLPEAPRKGQINLDFETCLAIAKLQVEPIRGSGVVEAVWKIPDWNGTKC